MNNAPPGILVGEYTIRSGIGKLPASFLKKPYKGIYDFALREGIFAVFLSVFCASELIILAIIPFAMAFPLAFFLFVLFPFFYIISRKVIKQTVKTLFRFTSLVILSALLGTLCASLSTLFIRMPSERLLNKFENTEGIPLLIRIDKAVSRGESYGIYDGTLITADGVNVKKEFGSYPKIRLSCFGESSQRELSVVSLTGTLGSPEVITNDGFRQRRYLEAQGIFISVSAESSITLIAEQKPNKVYLLREKLSDGINRYTREYSEDVSGIARCMLLGEKQAVTQHVSEVFRASGVSHVLCVSGMHLSILFLVISRILRLGKRKHRRFPLSELISCVIALTYMAVTDFAPSIMRAGFMLITANVFSAFMYYKRKLAPAIYNGSYMPFQRGGKQSHHNLGISALTCLLISCAIIGIISPYSFLDVGMQLSFMSTLGIIISIPILSAIQERFGKAPIGFVLQSLTVTMFAVGFTFPVSVYNFGSVSSMSPLTNLFLIPVVTPLLTLLLLLALMSLLPSLAPITAILKFLGLLCGILCNVSMDICEFFSGFTYSVLDGISSISVNLIFALTVSSALVLCAFRKKKASAFLGIGTVTLYIICLLLYFSNTYINRCIPNLTLCTVEKRPYACVEVKNSKIIFDCGTSLAKTKHALEVAGKSLYPTNNIYTFVLSSDFKAEYALENLDAFSGDIDAVLLPSCGKATISGYNDEEYIKLISELYERNYEIAYYSESFNVSGLEFSVITEKDKAAFTYFDTSLIFAKEYSAGFASRASENSEYCIYFSDKVSREQSEAYTSDAALFVSSVIQEKIPGSFKIPTARATPFPKELS